MCLGSQKRAARCDSVPGLMSLLFYCDRLNGLTVLCDFILRIGCRCIYKDQRSCQGHPGKLPKTLLNFMVLFLRTPLYISFTKMQVFFSIFFTEGRGFFYILLRLLFIGKIQQQCQTYKNKINYYNNNRKDLYDKLSALLGNTESQRRIYLFADP